MINSKKLLSSILVIAILCISGTLSAANPSPQARQMIQKLQAAGAKLATLNTHPVMTDGVNPTDSMQFKKMVAEDIKNIKTDIQSMLTTLKLVIDAQQEILNQ